MLSLKSTARDLIALRGDGGYPADYVIARLKGRRAGFIVDWRTPLVRDLARRSSDQQVWKRFLAEINWLHRQLDPSLQRAVAPVFGLFEIKTLVLCLRSKAAPRPSAVAALLHESVLDDDVKRIVLGTDDVRSSVAGLARWLGPLRSGFEALEASYASDNLKGVENALMRAYLQYVIARRPHRTVRRFFAALIDVRNAMALYKHRRWQIAAEPPFLDGGQMPRDRLADLLPNGDDDPAVETRLLKRVTRTIARMDRDDRVALVIAHMWRSYLQARNLALLHHSAEIDTGALAAEVIA